MSKAAGSNTTSHPFRWLRRAERGITLSPAVTVATGSRPPRLGILSGTFNPPTRAHLALAEAALEQLQLDEVLFVLPEVPPHKSEFAVPLHARAKLLAAAVSASPEFSAAVTRDGLFLDIDAAVLPRYPAGSRFTFLCGQDAAERILIRWPYPDLPAALAEMFSRFDFAVAARGQAFAIPPGTPVSLYATQIHRIDLPVDWSEHSATRVRSLLAAGAPVEEFVPEPVAALLRQHHWFQGREK